MRNRMTPYMICAGACALPCIALIGAQSAWANPTKTPSGGQASMSAVSARMSARDVREGLAAIFENEERAAAFCRNPLPTLQEMKVPVTSSADVTAKLVSSETPQEMASLEEGGYSAVPNIYGVVCINIGNFRSCFYSFDKDFIDNSPEISVGFERSTFENAIQADLKNIKVMMNMMTGPREYLRKLGVRVPANMEVSASLHTGDGSRKTAGRAWPACVTLKVSSRASSLSYTTCVRGSTSLEVADESTSCCSMQ